MKKHRYLSRGKRAIGALVTHNKFKIFFWTIIASLSVGLFFGYFILKIVSIDEKVITDNNQVIGEQHTNDKSNQSELPNLSVSVLQGGVFTKENNASALGQQIEQTNQPYVVRENESQFYVWISTLTDENDANKKIERLETKGINSVVKKWDIPSVTINLPVQEKEFFESFSQLLSVAVTTNKVEKQEMQQLIDQELEKSTFSTWYEELQTILSQEQVSQEHLLLKLLVHYEKFIKIQKQETEVDN